jgi:hypothetical protein
MDAPHNIFPVYVDIFSIIPVHRQFEICSRERPQPLNKFQLLFEGFRRFRVGDQLFDGMPMHQDLEFPPDGLEVVTDVEDK